MWKLFNKENPTSLHNKFTFIYVMEKTGMIKYCSLCSAKELWLEVFLITKVSNYEIMKYEPKSKSCNWHHSKLLLKATRQKLHLVYCTAFSYNTKVLTDAVN